MFVHLINLEKVLRVLVPKHVQLRKEVG